jgi:hypothetical protein
MKKNGRIEDIELKLKFLKAIEECTSRKDFQKLVKSITTFTKYYKQY